MSSKNVFFNLFKFISYQRMVCHDPTVGTYTLIVHMCVKSQVGYLPREAGTIGHKFSFKKTELILRPVFALRAQGFRKV